ncbi:MAG: transposase, partial [Crocinitomicaceae bacterium]|nr:transposase [Crocinitomicaceae bacterium]
MTPHKKRQKDTDAHWTRKNNANFFGYKNHGRVDAKTKLIENFAVSDVSVHDSQVMDELLTGKDTDQCLYADSAYGGEKLKAVYAKKKVISKVNEKGYRNKPLTAEQKATNRDKSKTRARVEHIVGFVENSRNGSFMRCIGIV